MGITYEDALIAQDQLEESILADPSVVSIGIVAETNKLGELTGDFALQVGVIDIEVYSQSLKHGHSAIPSEYLLVPEGETGEKKHIHIHVIKEGKIEALVTTKKPNIDDFPTATDSDLPESTQSAVSYTLKRRPSPCGQSIGHLDVTAGTMGCLLQYIDGPNANKSVYLLSNNHVIAANNLGIVGDEILQPGRHDSGISGRDAIAHLERWVPLNASGFNYVDAAIALVQGNSAWYKFVTPYISHIGVPTDVIEPKIGMLVEKVGRTTGHTRGEIVSARFSTKINYPTGTFTFRNQIRTTNMSKSGDSGACLIEQGTKNAVGLLFAGSDTASYFNPMSVVLSALSKEHLNTYPSGSTQRFEPEHTLGRSYSTGRAPSLAMMDAPTMLAKSKAFKTPRLPGKATALCAVGFFAVTEFSSIQAGAKSMMNSFCDTMDKGFFK